MKSCVQWISIVAGFFAFHGLLRAEYRAYELEVFDRVQKKSEIVITSFSPNDYILSQGGPQRTGVIVRASWICYGDTSDYKGVCPQPPLVNPKFQKGERVLVQLKHHVTDQWVGTIENAFFQPELRSNIYGVRFATHSNLYTRYYEANLEKAP